MTVVAAAGVAIEAISLGLVGILYAVYAQFTEPGTGGERMPVLKPLRWSARFAVLLAILNACAAGLAVWWLASPDDRLYDIAVTLFFIEIVALPPIAGFLVFRLFR